MCGRFTLAVEPDLLMDRYGLEEIPFPYQPRYNIAPGQMVPVVLAEEGRKRIGQLRWGLIPAWAKEEKTGFKMINAKAETLHEKPSFCLLLQRKRCIIPADGFFEWKQTDKGKQPMRIKMKDNEIFSLAGLYDTWVAPSGAKIHSCTIITVAPNRLVAEIHDRMPAILRREDEAVWLNRTIQDIPLLQTLLHSYEAEEMTAYPVHAMVGNVRNDLPACIEPLLQDA